MHGINVSDLIIANKINSKGVIYVNQHLRLPLSGEVMDMSKTPNLSFSEVGQQKTQPGITSYSIHYTKLYESFSQGI